jgi:hypothetical protein
VHLSKAAVVAGLLAAIAFGLYSSTLLPGQDLGDTASFQAIAGERALTARQGYPLYFAAAGLFVHAMPSNPARATNLASAVEAALAVGVLVLVGAELGGALVAGVVAALWLAGSYTFWSQAIIAEVYSLHAVIVGLSLMALLRWKRQPSIGRLAVFFAIYALGFGNHLQTVLLLPAFALFLFVSAPGGTTSMLRPRIVILALSIAGLFTLQYAWNFSTFYFEPNHAPFADLLKTFWFDVTKSDWRANMVVTIPWSMIDDRFAMYWFDVRQQVGVPGVVAALAGLAFLFRTSWRAGLLILVAWLGNWAFAFTYNVGDTHVFYLPSHLFVALAAGCGAGWLWHAVNWHLGKRAASGHASPIVLALVWAVVLAYPAWRAWDTYPAMDRSADTSPTDFFNRLTAGIAGDHEIFARDINWQLHNGLDYFGKYTKPWLPILDTPPSMLYFPILVWDNAAMGRDVVLTDGAAALVRLAYGTLLPVEPDLRVAVPTLAERVASLPAGTPYVLGLIDSYPETPLDPGQMRDLAARLGMPGGLPNAHYAVVAGRIGERPILQQAGATPFRAATTLDGHAIDARIECWLPADTIRRMGFGHVIVDRRHVLTLDRGASFVALNADGQAHLMAWAGGLLSPQPRWVIRHETVTP